MSEHLSQTNITITIDEKTREKLRQFFPIHGGLSYVIRTLIDGLIEDLESGKHNPKPFKEILRQSRQLKSIAEK